jgi:hypothetical protein
MKGAKLLSKFDQWLKGSTKPVEPKFRFNIRYTVRGLTLGAPAYNFDYGGPHTINVVVRAPADNEIKIGHKKSNAFCIASSAWPVNEKNRKVFEEIIENRILAPSEERSLEYKTPEGRQIRLPALSAFPQHFCSFIRAVHRELHDYASRTIATLRWRCNVEFGAHNPLSSHFLQWSIDGSFWHTAPVDTQSHLEVRHALTASERMLSEVTQIVNNGGSEPLHHNLFREAWEQRLTNPRSALVIGIGAAELGVKHCIATLVPDAEWLATNAPTPPVAQILLQYLPRLQTRCAVDGKVKPPPESILKHLKTGISFRNRVIHAGAQSPSTEELEEILMAVRELLWLLDFYVGFEWAFDFLSVEAKSDLRAQRKK